MASWSIGDGDSSKRKIISNIFFMTMIGGLILSEEIDEAFFQSNAEKKQDISYTQFMRLTNNKGIGKVTVSGTDVVGTKFNGDDKLEATYVSQLPENANIQEIFKDSDVDVTIDNSSIWNWDILVGIIMLHMAWGVFKETSFKKRLFKEKDIQKEHSDVKFDDVAGIDNVKAEVQEIVDFLKDTTKNKKLGAKMPKGLLLAGGPGNGKTLLAKAIAGEANIPFYSSSGTDFENMYYGGSAKQVRELFAKAREESPCIIFIDEIDAIGRKRSDKESASDSIVVELLSQMDGFEALDNVLIIAATNKPEVLDPALLRPGRFDRQIVVPSPDVSARTKILEVHTKNRPLHKNVDLKEIAQRTYGFSGADIANLVNEAAIFAARKKDAKSITIENFDAAIDRMTMGMRRNIHMSKEQQWVTAIHEAGHTILSLEKEKDGATPLHKVTIVPHGEALGLTMMRPDEEKYGYKLKELKSQLVVLFGGRIAEEIMLDGPEDVSTGASGDIQQATQIAWNMVTKFGFSELGPIRFGNGHEGYLGPSFDRDLDEHTASKVYEQVEKIILAAEEEARRVLTEKKSSLEKLAEELVIQETMAAEKVKEVIGFTPNLD